MYFTTHVFHLKLWNYCFLQICQYRLSLFIYYSAIKKHFKQFCMKVYKSQCSDIFLQVFFIMTGFQSTVKLHKSQV